MMLRIPVVLAVCALLGMEAQAQDALKAGFENPPNSARPRVWWHWMNGNITKEGIRLDLEWMKRVGIGGMQNFDAALSTPQVVEERLVYMSPKWKEAFRYAAGLAEELGLEMAIASSPGWSETGGPWVKPERAMKKYVWSETRVKGGARFTGKLERPPVVTGPFQSVPHAEDIPLPGAEAKKPAEFYSDAAVVAYRLPGVKRESAPVKVTTQAGAVEGGLLRDGGLEKSVEVPVGAEGGWVVYEYAEPRTARAAVLGRPPARMFAPAAPYVFRLEASDDGVAYRKVAEFGTTRVAQETVGFAAVTARYFRLKIEKTAGGAGLEQMFEAAPGADAGFFGAMFGGAPKQTVSVTEFALLEQARVHRFEEKAGFGLVADYYAIEGPEVAAAEAVQEVIDLSGKMQADGTLDWVAPAGEWVVLRLGYSLTGTTNHPATAEATGLEVDKLDAGAVKEYIETYLGTYREAAGAELLGKKGVKALLTDSIEVGPYNWTPGLMREFRRLRGYEMTKYLPALAGVVVGSSKQTERFLWDFRRTLGQLTADAHYGQIAQSARAAGLTYYGESLEGTRVSMGDDMEMRRHANIPMAAMWTYAPAKGPRSNYVIDIRGAASVAHVYGQNLVAAESLTSAMMPWAFSPRVLKPMIDLEFALGVNRPVIHTSVHQPVVGKKPGLTLMIFGQYFNRNETWAEQAGPWVTYLARNAYMLQQGRFQADAAYFYGEEAPLSGLYGEGAALGKDFPNGYGFDFVNSDIVLNQLEFANGAFETKSGMHYRVLVLGGSSRMMTLAVLKKIRAMVEAGGVVVGERPVGSPSLADNAAEFEAMAKALWGGKTGKGKVITGKDANGALAELGVKKDFDCAAEGLMFVHRRLADGDVYYVSNQKESRSACAAEFRVSGKRAQLWHADSGRTEEAAFKSAAGVTTVPLELEGYESVYVVFREAAKEPERKVEAKPASVLATIGGAWTVRFPAEWGAPASVVLNGLSSWSENAEVGVKYFSGTATYEKTFRVEAGAGRRVELDLGDVRELAEVSLNGKPLGVLWHAPYRVDITEALQAGENRLEVKVTNLWVNRLIGDEQPGAKRYTFTAAKAYRADAPLRPSGLLGPVTVRAVGR